MARHHDRRREQHAECRFAFRGGRAPNTSSRTDLFARVEEGRHEAEHDDARPAT